MLKNIPNEHMAMLLGVDCPTLLFPFTRQIVSQVSIDGGFVPFLMEPVNFMALFQNAKEEKRRSEKLINKLRNAKGDVGLNANIPFCIY